MRGIMKVAVRALYLLGVVIAGAVIVVATSGCTIVKVGTDVDQSQGITGPSTPGSPDPQCQVKRAELGTAADATTVKQGQVVQLILTLYGAQNQELSETCVKGIGATFTATAPCTIEGAGHVATYVRAPLAAPLGTICRALARAGGEASNEFSLTVVAP
jgi:hypothetical protein